MSSVTGMGSKGSSSANENTSLTTGPKSKKEMEKSQKENKASTQKSKMNVPEPGNTVTGGKYEKIKDGNPPAKILSTEENSTQRAARLQSERDYNSTATKSTPLIKKDKNKAAKAS